MGLAKRVIKKGAQVRVQFEDPENASMGVWFEGRIYAVGQAENPQFPQSLYKSLRVVWYVWCPPMCTIREDGVLPGTTFCYEVPRSLEWLALTSH